MLVLSRKAGESIVINHNIRVNVVSVKGGKVRLAIDAPPEVIINREEIHARCREFQGVEVIAVGHWPASGTCR